MPLDDQEKNICTLSSHRATRELYAKVPSHRAPVGAVCEGSMRIELRSELYAKGALCGSTKHHWGGGKAASDFGANQIRNLVSMATDSSDRVRMGKRASSRFLGCL